MASIHITVPNGDLPKVLDALKSEVSVEHSVTELGPKSGFGTREPLRNDTLVQIAIAFAVNIASSAAYELVRGALQKKRIESAEVSEKESPEG